MIEVLEKSTHSKWRIVLEYLHLRNDCLKCWASITFCPWKVKVIHLVLFIPYKNWPQKEKLIFFSWHFTRKDLARGICRTLLKNAREIVSDI